MKIPQPVSLAIMTRVFELSSFGFVLLDEDQKILFWNGWIARHSLMSETRVRGYPLFDIFPELQGQRLDIAIKNAIGNSTTSLLLPSPEKSSLPLFKPDSWGHEVLEHAIAVTPFKFEKESYCMLEVTDLSLVLGRERKLRGHAEVLLAQSNTDGLTGIANRRMFNMTIDREVRRADRSNSDLSLLLMDIDSFKAYNDFFGHPKGDTCLTQVATALANSLQRPGDLAARYGGEEFAAILPNIDTAQALQVAEKIRENVLALKMEHAPSAIWPSVTISIGVASFNASNINTIESLIEAADRGLYAAKHSGRNCVVVAESPAMGAVAQR
jgi:diguanylate cyclase (GGDEF)-like protein